MLHTVGRGRRRGGGILKKHLWKLALKPRQPITGGGGETVGGNSEGVAARRCRQERGKHQLAPPANHRGWRRQQERVKVERNR
jgi:hypothetical protein